MSHWKPIIDQTSGPREADARIKERIRKALLRSCGKAGYLPCCDFNKLLKELEKATAPGAIKAIAEQAAMKSHSFSRCACAGDCPFPVKKLPQGKPRPPL